MTAELEHLSGLRPSSLPMLEQCPEFEGQDSEDAQAGTKRHRLLTIGWNLRHWPRPVVSGDVLLDQALKLGLAVEDADGVAWALEYIEIHAAVLDHPIDFERKLVSLDADFKEVWAGTPDAVCYLDVFDLKWRERDYLAQMAGYRLLLQDYVSDDAVVKFHVLFGAFKRVEVYELDLVTATAIVEPIAARAAAPDREPRACDYCAWCSKRLTCSAFHAPAIAVAQGREDWGLTTYHVSQITDPSDMAKAIELRDRLVKWCEAVDYFKREWAVKQGIKIPGRYVRTDKGDREITNLNAALELSGLPVEKFILACSIGIGALKKIWAEHHGVSVAVAEKQIDSRLAAVINREPVQVVAKEKVTKERKLKNADGK